MPDAGKLLFNVRDRSPLSQILSKRTMPARSSDSNSSISTKCEEGYESNSNAAMSSEPPTLISPQAFELIESMIAYSGAARPSAKDALEFGGKHLMRTKDLEIQCSISTIQYPQASASTDLSKQDHAHEVLKQCVIHEREALAEVRELRKRTSNSASMGPDDDDDDYHDWSDSDIEAHDLDGDYDDDLDKDKSLAPA